MDLVSFLPVFERSLSFRDFIVVHCDCEVTYEGRAYSKLERGGRVVIIKPDRTVIVHRLSGRNPVNWMREGSSIKVSLSGDSLMVSIESINPREHMIVKVFNVLAFSNSVLSDEGVVIVNGTEADMSRMLYDTPSLISDDFIPVSLEEQTRYGFIDVLGHDGRGNLIIVECKRCKADFSAVQQLRRYVERVSKDKGVTTIRGVLAAPDITVNAKSMLEDWGFTYLRVNPPVNSLIDNSYQGKLTDFVGGDE